MKLITLQNSMFCKGYESTANSRLVELRTLTVTVCMSTNVLQQHSAFVFREVKVVTYSSETMVST